VEQVKVSYINKYLKLLESKITKPKKSHNTYLIIWKTKQNMDPIDQILEFYSSCIEN